MLDRLNVLELFGADKNKYHSCIITCYSFDFLFFEHRVLPMLRRAGMININIFVDAKMYQQQLSNLEGNYIGKQSYSITPIQLNGAFHPKILMGYGKNNGFLAIGSGNLTNSGLSSNDEVWGAFHTYKTESKVIPVFKSTFEYLKNLKSFCYGGNILKWDWLFKSSPWLSKLEEIPETQLANTGNQTITVLKNFKSISLYQELLDKLPNEAPKNITIIAPYYNKKGQLLTNFLNDLKPETMDVVVDDRFGTVPYEWEANNVVRFHNWESVKSNGVKENARLHAKIFQISYAEVTYIVTGSANATIEALGTKLTAAKNAEVSLLIEKKGNSNWLEELDINIPSKSSFDIKGYKNEEHKQASLPSINYNCYINYAEIDGLQLSIYLTNTNKISSTSNLVIEKLNGELSKYLLNKKLQTENKLSLNEQDVKFGFKVYIEDQAGKRISNFEKLHNVQLMQRTNPDEKATRFFEIINGAVLVDSDLETLLEFANFKDSIHINSANASRLVTLVKDVAAEPGVYDNLSEAEFNKNENSIEVHSKGGASHLTLLEDFLNNMTFQEKVEDLSDSSELDPEAVRDGGLSGNQTVGATSVKLSFHEGDRIRNKFQSKFEEINKSLVTKHKNLIDSIIEKTPSSERATIINLQSLLVGTHLIFMKSNEKYYEERFKLIVSFKDLDSLIEFEKTKGINLKRLEGCKNLKINEVAFSADAHVLSEIEKIVGTVNGVRLISKDETPSISITHTFFKNSPVFSKDKLDFYSKKGFLINSVSKILPLLMNGVEELNAEGLIKFEGFKNRLFYRVLTVFSTLKWSDKERPLAELFLLNVFYQLAPENIGIEDFVKELGVSKTESKIAKEDCDIDEDFVCQTFRSFLKWNSIYVNNKTALIKEMDNSTIGNIIFKSKLGFAILQSNYKGTLNVKTPLGFFNKDTKEFEIKRIKGGLNAIMYWR